jgi:hypothetical protein
LVLEARTIWHAGQSTSLFSDAFHATWHPNTGSYDYGQVLGLSFLFYEAQRSGKLPPTNRIAWRGDSGLDHRAPDGRDVTGGWCVCVGWGRGLTGSADRLSCYPIGASNYVIHVCYPIMLSN